MGFQLSPHFSLSEFTRSQTAARHGLIIETPESIRLELTRLCFLVLEPLRKAFGPVVVTSGYRPPELNRLIGGSDTSAHQYGRAADIVVPGRTPQAVAEWLASRPLPFDQVILEYYQWVHVSIAEQDHRPRRQALTAMRVDGRTVYLPGLQPQEAA